MLFKLHRNLSFILTMAKKNDIASINERWIAREYDPDKRKKDKKSPSVISNSRIFYENYMKNVVKNAEKENGDL